MNDNNGLHWSFDYNYGAQNPQFAHELRQTLRGHYTQSGSCHAEAEQAVTHVYNILPNFWRGYRRGNEHDEALSIGTAVIERRKGTGEIWNYSVRYQNTTSGEDVQLEFLCGDEAYRPLIDEKNWRVDSRNSGKDAYFRVRCDGELASNKEITLYIGDSKIVAGRVGESVPLTCNWTLFDVIPALAQTLQKSDAGVDIAFLDDLEQLRPKNRLGFLESIQTPIPLYGYYLYGVGVPPSYWWLDAHGDIAIVSSTFETLVLKEKMGDSS